MEISEKDQRVLKALNGARNQHEELGDLLALYHDLYEVQFRAKRQLPGPEIRDDVAMLWRLEGGIPQLTFDQLFLEPEAFAALATEVAGVLHRYHPGWELGPGTWERVDLLERAREVFDTWDTLTAPGPGALEGSEGEAQASPAMLAVGFALAPYLQRAAEEILPKLDLTSWARGHCPVCGGRPNFALLEEETGARQLMCSRCAALWPFRRVGCPFCSTEELPKYYASEDGSHRLYVCEACKGYLKAADLRKAKRVVHPMVERLLTVGMDLAAQQEGYGT
jgi:formate dehydrogenase maturation protein FdhE